METTSAKKVFISNYEGRGIHQLSNMRHSCDPVVNIVEGVLSAGTRMTII